MMKKLYKHQLEAVDRMFKGCILNGEVGSGKSLTSLAYFYLKYGGSRDFLKGGNYVRMREDDLPDLYIITTARKRDTLEWDSELVPFLLSTNPEVNSYGNKVVIDSWNNIGKYDKTQNAFFIFDEQRVVGKGAWVRSFLKIAKANEWILLTATPGDTWVDYIPVFIANGFYRNRTQFNCEHVIFDHRVKFPRISRYLNTRKLVRLRDKILIDMEDYRKTIPHHSYLTCSYDKEAYRKVMKDRWNVYENKPIENASQLCYTLRKVVNASENRKKLLMDTLKDHPKAIIFYNFNYERDILLGLEYGEDVAIAEWNGHKHEEIPTDEPKWVYLVQYTAGCEGWNCIQTDTIIFYSQNYSYKTLHQAEGRINRMNTPYTDLYYYHLLSKSGIDLAISKALKQKKTFSERKFADI